MRFEEMSAKLAEAEQSHVLAHWESLDEQQRNALERQIEDIDAVVGIQNLRPLFQEALETSEQQRKGEIEGPPADCIGYADGRNPEDELRWEGIGMDLIAQGKCAACVLAGGMGTRLGTPFPKGMLGSQEVQEKFLPSQKSLFQIYAERIIAMQRRAQKHAGLEEEPTIHFLVLTVEANYQTTFQFFQRNNYFGLRGDQVLFFRQASMPCFGQNGEMLLESEARIAVSPDGNAGVYSALRREGVLERLRESGVKWVQVFSVDNLLVRAADPVWYGYCEETGADVCVKTIPKRNWSEAVGVVTLRGGAPGVIEYSEIGDERAQETLEDGTLKYNAANICLQAYSLDFLSKPALEYKTIWHVARKDIPTIDGKKPGIKLEGFIFDVFEVAKNFRLLQVDRSAEFSAIKNASDSGKPDTPQTAVESLSRLHRGWLRKAGAKLPEDDENGNGPACEVSPLVSYRGESLEDVAGGVDSSGETIYIE
eukprot:CAMPEP_0176062854 /NCGR_PEP_ID=MMETSP0120_2-20121206/31344_1 /TAXON_ID=160619 /ORGANISM="Kryptoperidinium foliaceum, Strain CCMP 1326" /LENGTH=480 /DNA_ID=CAMNT_0017396421 /DNA_START=66 /DNA_END=1508 /DNA_ORIENTATION=+